MWYGKKTASRSRRVSYGHMSKEPTLHYGSPNYMRPYSERQAKIIAEEIPLEDIRINELTVIMKKAKVHDDPATYELVKAMRYRKITPLEDDPEIPELTAEEASKLIADLEPDWLRDLKAKIAAKQPIGRNVCSTPSGPENQVAIPLSLDIPEKPPF